MTQRRRPARAGVSAALGIGLCAGSVPTLPASAQNVILIRSAVHAQHLADTTVRLDPGIGVVSPRGGAARDSLALFLSTAETVTWGWFKRDLSGGDEMPFVLWTPVVLRPNILEISYEESGLPVDSIAPDRVRVLLGWDDEGRMRRAWVRRDSTVELQRWGALLSKSPLFFRPGVSTDFFAAPRGARYPVVLPGGEEPDYIMHPKRISGQWMQVEVVTPSDYCADDTARRRKETVWIRFLDQGNRPRVWYYTRGC